MTKNMKTKIFTILICNLFLCNLLFAQSDITYDPGTSIDISTGADVCADAIIINGVYSGGGTICTGALPVSLSSFTYTVNTRDITLMWVTEWELNNSGFDVERANVTPSGVEGWSKAGFVSGHGTSNMPNGYIFKDKKLKTGTYKYRLKQIDYNSNYEYFDLMQDVIVEAPGSFSMGQNYPNPSNPKSKIDYEIPISGKVTIKLFNLLGQEVVSIVNETREAGYYTAEFDGTNLASGVYIYRITAEGNGEKFSKTLKMVLVK